MTNEEQPADMLARLGSDGLLWAQEFNKIAVRLGYSEMDEGWLIGWFANAIENSCNPLRNECDRLREENARLREALKPFADELKEQQVEVPHVTEDESLIHSYTLRLKHLRTAAAAIREGKHD